MADNAKGDPGFKFVRSKFGDGAPKAQRVPVATAYAGAINGGTTIDINIGDPVRRLATGYFAHAAGNEAAANAAQDIWGICVGIAPYWDGSVMTPGNRLPATTPAYGTNFERTSYIYVIPGAAAYWSVACDDKTTATTEAAYRAFIGENADHRLTTGSEPKTNCLLDISTHVDTTAQWRIEGIMEDVAQDFSGLYVRLVVALNEGQQSEYTASGI